jgi:hypothetical protein
VLDSGDVDDTDALIELVGARRNLPASSPSVR